ncbi:MAG: hypothetical protein WBN77_06620, partial [Desulfobacterales bacterium]
TNYFENGSNAGYLMTSLTWKRKQLNRKNYNKSMNPTPSKLRFLSLAGGGVGYFRRSVPPITNT